MRHDQPLNRSEMSALTRRLPRRGVVRGALGAAAGASLLGRGAARAQTAATPAAGDGMIPSGVPGVPDAYWKLPPPFQSVAQTPGAGGTVSALTIGYNPPPTPRGDNTFWQELEQRLGVEWEITIAPASSYAEVTAVQLAGGDLPDLFYINPGQNAFHLYEAIDQGAFTDLTPYLTGDALQEFPNLARIAEPFWRGATVKGKLYGVPKTIARDGGVWSFRSDWMETLGLAAPANADELFDLFVGFTTGDPDGNGNPDTWGLTAFGGDWYQAVISPMFRVPNGWRRNDDGTLTNAIETDEYRQTVAFMRRLYEAGAYHPDAATMTFAQYEDAFNGSRFGFRSVAVSSLFGTLGVLGELQRISPEADLLGVVIPGHDGGPGVTHNRTGVFGYTGIPASIEDEDRIKELLRILDYLSAPVGSEEWVFLTYGIEGTHHTLTEDGGRELTDKGAQDMGDLVYMLATEFFLYLPGAPDDAEAALELTKQALAIGIDNPVATAYSPTFTSESATLRQLQLDRISAIVTGREPIEALDQFVADWRERGGDQIREEYQASLGGS